MDKEEKKELEIEEETKRQEEVRNSPTYKKMEEKKEKWDEFEDNAALVGATDGEVMGDDI